MAWGVGAGLGDAVGVIERVAGQIASGSVPMRRRDVVLEAERRLRLAAPDRASQLTGAVVDQVMGLGPLEELLRDPEVTDVLVNGPEEVWVDRAGVLSRVDARFDSDESLIATVERVIAPLGLRIDHSSPMVDARLPDGSRLHAVAPPASIGHPIVAIRRFTQAVSSLDALVALGTATAAQTAVLEEAVRSKRTIIVSGGTGAGKTTLLNVLGSLIPATERVVTIEDAAELRLPGHVVRLEAHPANAEGAGEITIRSLLKSALRLRPDRIIVGEVRGPEALDLVWALNTGHRGSLSTVHANSPAEALWRLETLALSAGDTSELSVRRQLNAAVDYLVQIERVGVDRRIQTVATVDSDGEIGDPL
jgi:pilus assembly protein CpaF